MPSLFLVWILDYTYVNKLHLGSSTLAFSGLLITEYTTSTMNPAVSRLLCLCQGDRPIEDYVQNFCGLCNQVDFNDVALKDIF